MRLPVLRTFGFFISELVSNFFGTGGLKRVKNGSKIPQNTSTFQTLLIVKNLLSFQNFGFGFGLGPGQGQGLVPFPRLFHIWYQCSGKSLGIRFNKLASRQATTYIFWICHRLGPGHDEKRLDGNMTSCQCGAHSILLLSMVLHLAFPHGIENQLNFDPE